MHWAAAAILTAFYGLHLPVMLAVRLSAGELKNRRGTVRREPGPAPGEKKADARRLRRTSEKGGVADRAEAVAANENAAVFRPGQAGPFGGGAHGAGLRSAAGRLRPAGPGGGEKQRGNFAGISRPLRGGRNSAGIGGAAGGRGGSGGAIREGTYCGAAFGKKYGQKGGKAEETWKNIPFRA